MSSLTSVFVPEIEKKERASKDCSDERRITIAVVGDILMLPQVQLSAATLMNTDIADPYRRVASGFEGLFSSEVQERLSKADLTFGNLETPIAEGLTKQWNYKKYCFQAHYSLCNLTCHLFSPLLKLKNCILNVFPKFLK